MKANHVKTKVEPNVENSCLRNILHAMVNAQHNNHIMTQPLPKTFR